MPADPEPPYETATAEPFTAGADDAPSPQPDPGSVTPSFHEAAQSFQPAPEPYPSNPAPPSQASLPAPFPADPAPPFHQDSAPLFQADPVQPARQDPAPFYMPEEAPPQHASPLQTDPLPPPEAQPGQSFQGSAAPTQGDGSSAERPTESIVPDSWFAEPRRTGPREYEQPAQQWTPQPAPAGAEVDPWAPQPGGWGGQPQHTELLQGFPEGPGFAGGRPAPGRGQANKALIVGVAGLVAIALLALGLVMWPDDSPKADANASPSTRSQSQKTRSGPAHVQATSVNALLNASAASRGELGRALAAARRCEGIPAAIGGMQRVAEQRRQQFARARAMRVSALQNGPRLRSTLARSIRLSLDVDQAFLTWAQGASRKCKKRPRPDGHFRRGNALSAQASVAKQRFAALWAPVARKEGLRPRTATQF